MAFKLTISDNVETVDLIDGTNFDIADGGFDIGMPGQQKSYGLKRSGPWFEPAGVKYSVRRATVIFTAYGATRTAILSNLNKIERIMRSAEARQRLSAGRRCQLQYQWDGAANITYFEILGGELRLPPDVLSVGKMHVKEGTNYYVPEITLELDLSPFGYGISIYNSPGASQELALDNPNVASAQTGGILVENPFAGNYNYVEIASSEVPGAQPYITKIVINGVDATSQYVKWKQMFIGHRVTPFPTTIFFEGEARNGGTPIPSTRTDANASGGSEAYWSITTTGGAYFSDIFARMYWNVDPDNTTGLFYAFIQAAGVNYSTASHFAVGVYDYVQNGYRYISDWVNPRVGSFEHLPVGLVQIPPELQLADLGNAYTSYLGLFYGCDSGQSSLEQEVDFLSLLPIDNGLRVWVERGVSGTSNLEGDMVDDAWLGVQYMERDDNSQLTTPFFGMLDPIKLEPNVTQRLYFTSVGADSGANEGAQSFRVQVYGVPMYKTLAL